MKKYLTFILVILLSFPLLAQVERKVIIEHFTNTLCGICASRNPAFYQTLADYPQVLHIAYHPSSPYPDCFFNKQNPEENDSRANFYGVYGGTPRAVIQGEVIPVQNPMVGEARIEAHLGKSSDYRVTVTNALVSGSTYKAAFEIERVNGDDWENILVFAGLAEKEIPYNASNGEKLHHDVFRRWVFSETVDVNPVGTVINREIEYTRQSSWDVDELFAYVIVQDAITLEVKQSASSLNSPAFIGSNPVKEIKNLFYPNPVSGSFNVRADYAAQIEKVELFSMVGSKVKEFNNATEMNISDLPDGLYFVKLTDNQKKQFSTRIIKSH